jgi:DNA-binding IclR family transcriptional regulator
MTDKTRTTESGSRLLRVISALKGHTISGLTNGDIAKALGATPSTINRDLNTLIAEGFAIKLDSGRYALSVKLLQIAQAHANEISRAQGRIDELNQRVHAGAHR